MFLLAFVLFYVLLFVRAVPLVKRIVVSPHITSPNASTTWNVGDVVTVTWCEQLSLPYPTLSLSCGVLRACIQGYLEHPAGQLYRPALTRSLDERQRESGRR